jgi:dTMP kinase
VSAAASRRGRGAGGGRRARGRRTGRFVVLEGLDGAGTTTQARLLGEALRAEGRRGHVPAEPSRGPVGALIREVLGRRVGGPDGAGFDPAALALLFAADRVAHVAAEVTPHLRRGADVVSDRFTLSSLAYQGLTTGDVGWVAAVNSRAAVPDLVVFLRVRAAVAFRRRRDASTEREIFEEAAFLRRVARSYDRALTRLRRAGQRVVEVDGEAPVAAVAAAVRAAVERLP